MKTKGISRALGALVALLGLTVLGSSAFAQNRELGSGGELLEAVAAVVDNGVVLKSELTDRVGIVVGNMRKQQEQQPAEQRRQLPPVPVIEQQVLDQLVLRELQLQRAKKVGITVSDDMLNNALARVAENLGYTLEELPTVLASENLSYSQYREDSRQDLMIEQLQQRDVINRINISPRELELCLAAREANQTNTFDYNISHILISIPGNATPDQIETARRRSTTSTRDSRPAKTSRASRSPPRRRRRRSTAAASAGARVRSCRRCSPIRS